MLPLSFGFTLVRAEKAISSSDGMAFGAERENGTGCISSPVWFSIVVVWVCSLPGLQLLF